jgi:hypothetical protein
MARCPKQHLVFTFFAKEMNTFLFYTLGLHGTQPYCLNRLDLNTLIFNEKL